VLINQYYAFAQFPYLPENDIRNRLFSGYLLLFPEKNVICFLYYDGVLNLSLSPCADALASFSVGHCCSKLVHTLGYAVSKWTGLWQLGFEGAPYLYQGCPIDVADAKVQKGAQANIAVITDHNTGSTTRTSWQ